MEDDDEFGDLYTDVIGPFESSQSSSALQPHQPSTAPQPHRPSDLNLRNEEDEILYAAPHSNPSLPHPPNTQTLAPADSVPANSTKDADSADGSRVLEDKGVELPKVDSVDSNIGSKSVDLMDNDVNFDIEDDDNETDDMGLDPVIPGLSETLSVNDSAVNIGKPEGSRKEGERGEDDWDSDDSEDDLQIVLKDNNHWPMAMERGRIGGDAEVDDDHNEDGLVIVADDELNQPMEEQEWGEDGAQAAEGERKEMGEAGKAVGGGSVVVPPKVGYSNPFHSQFKMSLAESPVHSSSSDDFTGFLERVLGSGSSHSSPDEEADYESDDGSERSTKRRKVENLGSIEETHGSTSQVFVEENSEASPKKDICTHPGSVKDLCIVCGQRVDEKSGVPLGYIHKDFWLNNDEIDRVRSTDIKKSLHLKKLYLVLDLDHTLLNSTHLNHMTAEEEYLHSQTDSLQDVSNGSLFRVDVMHMMTKLRPFVRKFLKVASEMFEMYIYTMGERAYALEMAKLLDPRKEYFGDRVISRDDGTQKHQKGLDIVLGHESAALILDDTENAWTKHKDNLILMERYHFFRSSCHQFGFHCKSLSELKSDESEPEGALATVLEVLKRIHNMFFYESKDNLIDRDVRQVKNFIQEPQKLGTFFLFAYLEFIFVGVICFWCFHRNPTLMPEVLKTLRKEILKGCKIVFSRVFPSKFQAENHQLWKMAEQLGATCSTELDPSVTHVVSTDAGTEKSRWAVKENLFLVHPQWIEASNYMWLKQAEDKFPVKQTKT